LPFCERGSTLKLAGKITEEDAWKFLHDVASGLAYLHKQNPPVIHQDIKPDNVLMDNAGQFMITDFGISTKVRRTLRKSIGQQTSGGTFAYMGPERFSRDNIPIKASDIWALGATLYELLTGDVPFSDNGGAIQKSGAEIPDMKGNISSDLKNIVNLCLQKETWDRPTAEKIVTWTEQHFRKKKINSNKNKTRLITVICVVVILLVALIIGIGVHTQQEKQRMQELYSQFDKYKIKGDSLYLKGENGYKNALEMYDKALEVAEKIEKSGKTALGKDVVSTNRKNIAAKIDNIFSELVKMGNGLEKNGNEVSKRQAIANYEEALSWKDDDRLKNKLNRLKQANVKDSLSRMYIK
jgi:serine/threonine protein kinase